MKSDAWTLAKREQQRHRQAAEACAMKLDKIGMAVIVVLDSGQEMHTTLSALPWTLGCGLYVAKVEGISGGFDCARIRPAVGSMTAREVLKGIEAALGPKLWADYAAWWQQNVRDDKNAAEIALTALQARLARTVTNPIANRNKWLGTVFEANRGKAVHS